ncbi:UDP-N-acetylmuramoyl-tripeptide--D-alanyl-D-alanine ligase [compost metagenome]
MLTLEDILKATGGTPAPGLPSGPVAGISTDTRSLQPGSLYVPLKGAKFDGHDFLEEAVRRGATTALISREVDVPKGLNVIRVQDTLASYGDLARYWREKLGLTVVGITGSSGKTSTKEMVASLLGQYMPVGKTHANFNNEIGLPRTLLETPPETRACVLEMGMRGPGEIAYLTSIARPNVGILTNIGTAHIGRLGSREAIARAKGELLRIGGPTMAAVINHDDPYAMAQAADHPGPMATFSLHDSKATVWAEGKGRTFVAHWQEGPQMRAGSVRVTLPFLGDHHRANALAAIATAWHLGLDLPPALAIAPEALPGRARTLTVAGIDIVDETYNANPESMRMTIQAFCQEEAQGRRFLAIGQMGELGDYAVSAHRELGEQIAQLPIAGVVTMGELAQHVAQALPGRAEHVADHAAGAEVLASWLKPGDRLFVKGSRSMQMEVLITLLVQNLEGKATPR